MDTFKLKIKNFTPLDQSFFAEVKTSRFPGGAFKQAKTNNAVRKQLTQKGDYAPKFQVLEYNFREIQKWLVIEFSAPKLLHGTSILEVTENDFSSIVDRLSEFLKSIKVAVRRSDIENAIVASVAYAKNIPIGQFGTAQEILRIINPFDYRPRSQFNKAVFSQGQSHAELKYFNDNSHLVLYDKVAELTANASTHEEHRLVRSLKNQAKMSPGTAPLPETLRVELTLHTPTAIRQVFAAFYDKRNHYTFAEAFKNRVCTELLRAEVDAVFNHPLQKIILLSSYDHDVFNQVINEYCKTLSQKSDIRFALDVLYTRGLGAYRNEVLKQSSRRTWFRKLKKLKAVADSIQLPSGASHINNAQVLEYILAQFGIESKLTEPKQLSLLQTK